MAILKQTKPKTVINKSILPSQLMILKLKDYENYVQSIDWGFEDCEENEKGNLTIEEEVNFVRVKTS